MDTTVNTLEEGHDNDTRSALPAATPLKASSGTPNANIDPLLLHARLIPDKTPSGDLIPKGDFVLELENIKVRKPFLEACVHLNIRHAKRDNLPTLRAAITRHWYGVAQPSAHQSPFPSPSHPPTSPPSSLPPSSSPCTVLGLTSELEVALDLNDAELVRQFDTPEGHGRKIFGALDSGGLEDVGEDEEEDNNDDEQGGLKVPDLSVPGAFKKYQTQVRVSAAKRWEDNRRTGGKKTQKAVSKCWNTFLQYARPKNIILDEIVDEHSMLVYLDYTATRCRRDRRGNDIPNTRVGASYQKAGVKSHIKVHLARHMLGYQQERMGVTADETSRLGWSRDTYRNTYAPALPKTAILAAHGFKLHESYDPKWRQVVVPPHFLKLVCPQAEERLETVINCENLVGAANYWRMAIQLRPFFFQGAAAIYQVRPKSALFRLPALANPDVQQWMKGLFPTQLALSQSLGSDPVNLERLQNDLIRQSIEQLRHQTSQQSNLIQSFGQELNELKSMVNRRTAQWSPAKAVDVKQLQQTSLTSTPASLKVVARQLVFESASAQRGPVTVLNGALAAAAAATLSEPFSECEADRAAEDTGMYYTADESLRGFVVPSPSHPLSPRPRTDVDLVLPPLTAFRMPGDDLFQDEPLFGTRSVQWHDVFKKIKQPEDLREVWKPSGSLDDKTVEEIWACFDDGEAVFDGEGQQSGLEPPLRKVEATFKARWRPGHAARKAWQRFREIPEWIDSTMKDRGLTASEAVQELETLKADPSLREDFSKTRAGKLSNNRLSELLAERRKKAVENLQQSTSSSSSTINKKRKPAIGARPKPKRPKIDG